MRIGLFSDTYVPDINGVASSVATLQHALEEAGHTVFVITTQSTLMSATLEDNVLRLPGVELKFLYGYTMSSPVHISAMRAIEEMNLDIIHAHTEFGIGIFARQCARSLYIPLVITYHTQYEDYTHYVNFLGLKSIDTVSKKAVAALRRFYSKNVQAVIVPSQKTKDLLMNYDIRKKIAVIPSGLNLKSFKEVQTEEVASIRQELDLNDKFTIVYLGRIAEEKSLELVIDAVSKLMDEKENVRMIIAGDGPSVDDLKNQVSDLGKQDKFYFVGSVMRDRVPAYYHASDAFVSASLTETQGLTFIEALASGLCVFARPDRALDDLIIEGETGYLFSDIDAFVEKAVMYIDNYETLKDQFQAKAQEIVSGLSSETFAKNILDCYQEAIDSYHGKYEIEYLDQDEERTYIDIKQGFEHDKLVFDTELIQRRGLSVGMKLSRNEINSLEEDQKIYEAYQAVLKRIAIRDYTSFEISDFLRTRHEMNEEQVETILEILKKRRFINDDRYFKDKIDYHRDQLRGNEWIIEDLSRRGFSKIDIENTLLDEDHEIYVERGLKRAINYSGSIKEGSRLQRNSKVRQHLLRQGFEVSVIREIMSQLEDDYTHDAERASLMRIMSKAFIRYLRKDDEQLARTKTINYGISKGYPVDMVKDVMEELDDDSED
ncbi:1,2-diacylglycerol 3-glucosyltransferase [Erysipelothrix larvae]|uniref:Regulatory protein RecX n=1 Tax=Erysipelothrix larvae TaxID=1514105 RepID=A0A109UGX3_9FIRM|nr:RecX family transcriptional regulator [Erysipelothrix larvae]AMC93258.1 1,2-diacylglycerol 3-glucosyltransferase [Erysipelothrix larvae]